jgi:hypothetical protein
MIHYINGYELDEASRARLRQLADSEDAVFVPASILDRLAEQG